MRKLNWNKARLKQEKKRGIQGLGPQRSSQAMTGPIQHGPSLTRYKKTIFFNIFNRFYVSCSFNYFCVISRTQFGFVSAGLRLPKLKCRRKRKKEKNGGRKHGPELDVELKMATSYASVDNESELWSICNNPGRRESKPVRFADQFGFHSTRKLEPIYMMLLTLSLLHFFKSSLSRPLFSLCENLDVVGNLCGQVSTNSRFFF